MGLSLDIGCGVHKHLGALGVDRRNLPGVAVVCDFEQGLPFRDGSVTTVFLHNTVEHMDDLVTFMEELYRVCEPGAKVYVRTPYYASREAFVDPTHVRYITEATFEYFDPRTIMGSRQTLKFAPRISRCENRLNSCRAISRNASVDTSGMPV